MTAKVGRRAVAIAVLHMGLSAAMILYASAAGLTRFDNPDLDKSLSEAVATRAASVLLLPARIIWTDRASANLPNAVEWLLFAANSSLWGIGLAAGAERLSSRRSRSTRETSRHTV